MQRLNWILPLAVVVLGAGMLLRAMRMPQDGAGEAEIHKFATIPVVDKGRIKPLDTLARTSLLALSGRSEYVDLDGRKQPAIRWLLEVMCNEGKRTDARNGGIVPVRQLEVFRIENDQVLGMLRMTPRSGFRYSLDEVYYGTKDQRSDKVDAESESNYQRINARVKTALAKRPRDRDLVDRKILELKEKLNLYNRLAARQTPLVVPPALADEQWQSLADVYEPVRQHRDNRVRQLSAQIQQAAAAGRTADVGVLRAKLQAEEASRNWAADLDGQAALYAAILDSYEVGETSTFNAAVDKYLANLEPSLRMGANRGLVAWLAWSVAAACLVGMGVMVRLGNNPAAIALAVAMAAALGLGLTQRGEMLVTDFELFYNQFEPFYQSAVLCIAAFMMVIGGWLALMFGASRPFWRGAFWLLLLVFSVQTFAMIGRMYIQGRPPVTNLYSSAIFIGWIVVMLGLIVEPLTRLSLATLVASLIGFLTLIVAHHLGNDGDTMEMLQAVLDTNFWLATHVTTVTIGYAATFFAAGLGATFILAGVFSPVLKKDVNTFLQSIGARPLKVQWDFGKLLSTVTYGVVCFALFFSFVGTVLGGIWADQSWGRFWGWDPKENGAVLIVIWNSLVLHARWGGMVRQRGLAVLSVFGGVVTAWSWFGTNMLEIGLHSYGFIPSAIFWLATYIISQIIIMGIGLLPERYWISYLVDPKPRPRINPRRGKQADPAGVS